MEKTNFGLMRGSLVFSLTIGLILSLGTAFLALAASYLGLVTSFGDREVVEVRLDSAEDLLALKGCYMNDHYVLEKDIVLEDIPFSFDLLGTFDGRGHHIYVEGDYSRPLFEEIGPGASVLDLNLVYEGTYVAASDSFGGLALSNYGTIERVSVCYEQTVELSNTLSFGGLTVLNAGTIKEAVVKLTAEEDPSLLPSYCVGGLASFLASTSCLEESVSLFKSRYSYLGSPDEIVSSNLLDIGLCYGNRIPESKIERTYVLAGGLASDRKDGDLSYVEEGELDRDFYVREAGFEAERWDFGGEMPVLKEKMEAYR